MPETPEPGSRRRAPRGPELPLDDQPFGDLSEAAREAVRHPADPRIDTHLASLGLAGDETPSPRRARITAADLAPRLDELRAAFDAQRADAADLRGALASARDALARAERRLAWLTYALVVLGVVAVAALLLALLR